MSIVDITKRREAEGKLVASEAPLPARSWTPRRRYLDLRPGRQDHPGFPGAPAG